MPLPRERHPDFLARHQSTIPFIITLNEIIHPEVWKLYPGAGAPDFGFRRTGADELELEYRSGRKRCALAEVMERTLDTLRRHAATNPRRAGQGRD